MDKKFLKGILTGVIAVLFLQGIFLVTANVLADGIGVYSGANNSVLGSNAGKTLSKMNALRSYIDEYYMEDVGEEELANGIYKGMLESLDDPYSCYYTEDEYNSLMESSSGTYCGIGASVTQDAETGIISIVTPFKGGAAADAGIESGDVVSKVDGKDVSGMNLDDVVAMMKGKEGTTVEVEFYLIEKEEYKTFTLERKEVEVPTVAYEMKNDNIGYIAVSAFDEPTDEQFISAAEDLENQGMEALIVDLRNNGGGMLTSVVNMLDYLLPKGSEIVSTKDKYGKGETYKATSEHVFDLPMVVLINGNTASASEVFSGAIQDYGLGALIGTTSFGKGIVQSVIPLNDGTAIKLTTSYYYTPKGRNIHGTGIEPDVEVTLDAKDTTDTQYNQAVRILEREMKNK